MNKGLGFFPALQLVLITLKFCNVINWSWFLVLLPIELGIILAILSIIGFFAIFAYFDEN